MVKLCYLGWNIEVTSNGLHMVFILLLLKGLDYGLSVICCVPMWQQPIYVRHKIRPHYSLWMRNFASIGDGCEYPVRMEHQLQTFTTPQEAHNGYESMGTTRSRSESESRDSPLADSRHIPWEYDSLLKFYLQGLDFFIFPTFQIYFYF